MLKKYSPVDSLAWRDENANKLKLDWNESNSFLPSIHGKILEFLSSPNITYYPDLDNDFILRKISEYSNLKKENVELTASSDYGHEIVLKYLSYKIPNLTCLILTPTYDNFRSTAETMLKEVITRDLGVDYYKNCLSMDFEEYDLVYLSNPNNPTTDFLEKHKLKEVLMKYPNTYFLVDEAYIDFDLHLSVQEFVQDLSNIIISRTFSKAFGLAAFRVGYLLSSEKVRLELSRFNNEKYVNSFAKIAVTESLENLGFLKDNIEKVAFNKIKIINHLEERKEIKKVIYGGGNFILVECLNSEALWHELRENSIYVRSLSHLKGMENYLRITIPVKGLNFLMEKI